MSYSQILAKNIIIFVLLVIIGGLAIVSVEELKTIHAAQAYIEALETDFPNYLDTTVETDAYLDYYERIR